MGFTLGDHLESRVDPGRAVVRAWEACETFSRVSLNLNGGGGESALRGLIDATTTLVDKTDVPTEEKHQHSQITLLANICSLLHQRELSGQREAAYIAARERLAATMLAYFGMDASDVDGDAADPEAVGKSAWQGPLKGRWYNIANTLQKKAVLGDTHPFACLNIGAHMGFVDEVLAFKGVRELLLEQLDTVPDEVDMGWTGANVVDIHLNAARTIEFDADEEDAIRRAEKAFLELERYARRRGWIQDEEAATDEVETTETAAETSEDFASFCNAALDGLRLPSDVREGIVSQVSIYGDPTTLLENEEETVEKLIQRKVEGAAEARARKATDALFASARAATDAN